MLFTKDSIFQARVVSSTLNEFCRNSGLKINGSKSKAFASPRVSRATQENFKLICSISFTKDLGKYLGIPICQGRANKSHFDHIVSRLKQKLSTWKGKLLNRVGRLTLAKSSLTSILVHSMQTLWLPQSICNGIDKLVRDFFWHDNADKGMHWASWDLISSPKNQGGLGIRSTRVANISLLGKSVWDLLQNVSNKLWSKMWKHKYLKGENPLSHTPPANASYVWKSVSKATCFLKDGFRVRIGNGESTSLWNDLWVSFSPLRNCLDNNSPIVDYNRRVHNIISNGCWDLQMLAGLVPNHVIDLIKNISLPLLTDMEDSWYWESSPDGVYSARTTYFWLASGSLAENNFPIWNWLWKLKVPENIKLLLWFIFHKIVLVNELRWARGVADSALCSRCNQNSESILHCFRDCPFASRIWHKLSSTSAVSHFFTLNLDDWLNHNLGRSLSLDPGYILSFICTIWWIW